MDTLFLPISPRYSSWANGTELKFPIVHTGNQAIDSLINKDLVNRFTHDEFPDDRPDSAVIKWADDAIVFIGFEVTYLRNGLLSLNISAEGMGAYLSQWTDYYTYSIITGNYVPIDEVVDTSGKFREIVLAEKKRQYDAQRMEIKQLAQDSASGIDENTSSWALEQYDYCEKDFDFSSFALYPDHLEIIDDCTLPNAIKNLSPHIELHYKYSDISKFLKLEL